MLQPIWNSEQEPWVDDDRDESGINLRAYFDRMSEERLQQSRQEWSEQQVTEWDSEFISDGQIRLACSERDIEIDEYRRVIAEAIQYRNRVRRKLAEVECL